MLKKITVILLIIIILGSIAYYMSTRKSVRFYFAGRMIEKQTFENEKKLRAKIHFTIVKKGWINRPLKTPMDEIWKDRIGRKGMNYFLVGSPKSIFSKYSERFNPKSELYQAWFGCYTILDREDGDKYGFENGKLIWEELIQLAVEDQNAWLEAYRVENPNTKITEMIGEPSVVNINNIKAHLSFWKGESQSDLNENGSISEDLNGILGIPNKDKWNKMVKAHHPVILNGFFIVWRDPSFSATFCCYGCGVEFADLSGKKLKTFNHIQDDLLEMARRIKIKFIE